jgi:hypothetical protein
MKACTTNQKARRTCAPLSTEKGQNARGILGRGNRYAEPLERIMPAMLKERIVRIPLIVLSEGRFLRNSINRNIKNY